MPRPRKFLRPTLGMKFTPELKEKVLEELAKCFVPVPVVRSFGISPETYRQHLKKDPEFRAAVAEARAAYAQSLRREVHRRGVEGWTEPVFFQGVEVGKVRKYSDSLLIRHISRFDPTYREATKVEQKTTIVGSIETLKSRVATLPEELRQQLRTLAKAMREAKKAPPPPEE